MQNADYGAGQRLRAAPTPLARGLQKPRVASALVYDRAVITVIATL